jgi:phage terminase large subunit-like protein
MPSAERLRAIVLQDPSRRVPFLESLSEEERDKLLCHWPFWARTEQLPPPGDWRVWMICAGRGFGKTRAGAEWVGHVARSDPNARIALVGSSIGEVRSVMVEGESGILACAAASMRPQFEASLKRLTWPNGAQAFLHSAGEPESLRGPQFSHGRGSGPKGILRQ